MTKSEDELTHRVYNAHKANPVKGDWIEYLKKDFELIGEDINEQVARETSKNDYKNIIKSKIREEVFKILKKHKRLIVKLNKYNIEHLKYKTI